MQIHAHAESEVRTASAGAVPAPRGGQHPGTGGRYGWSRALRWLAAALAATLLPALAAEPLDPADPVDNLAIEMGMACSSTDPHAPHYYVWTGKLYSRRSGEPDRHLFNVQGVNPRACKLLDDPRRGGAGYLSTGRELMLYLDPDSNAVLDRWVNPWTGETVKVAHMVNDPANSPPTFPFTSAGEPRRARFEWSVLGDYLVAQRTRRVFRDNPMGGDYQEYVGGHLHAFESSNMIVPRSSLQNHRPGQYIPYIATWTRISQWLPWMRMGGRDQWQRQQRLQRAPGTAAQRGGAQLPAAAQHARVRR